MDEIVSKILELEQRAENLASETNEDEKKFENELKKKINELKKTIDSDTQEKIALAVSENEKSAGEKINKIQKAGEEKKIALDNIFAENKEKWINNIFDSIIK